MPWANIERAIRMGWTGLLLCYLLALSIQCLLAAAGLQEGPETVHPVYSPIWESEGFETSRAYFHRQALTAGYWLFAIAGLWIRQSSRWINWAWTLPWAASVLIRWLNGDFPLHTILDH